jgi:hypothetical protein
LMLVQMMSMLLYSLFVLPFSVSVSLDLAIQTPMYSSCFLPEHLSDHCQGLCCMFSKIWTKFDALAVR